MQGKGTIFVGKTLDDAVKKGLEALGLSRAAVIITTLEEGTGGFLGIGARPYKIRMAPRPRRELAEPPRREREGRARGERPERENERRPRRGQGRGEPRGGERQRPAAVRSEAAPLRRDDDRGERHERGERSERRRRRGGERVEGSRDRGRGREGEVRPAPPPRPEGRAPERRQSVPQMTTGAVPEEPGIGAAELEVLGRERTQALLQAMGFEAKVTARAEGTSVEVKAEVPTGGDLLVGPKGEIRQALQHILNRMINREQASRYHLQLEVNDFWHQREAELQAMARDLAEQAVADGAEKLTEYLNAQERRIVHMTLREDSRVTTHALGDGLIKKISIAPAEASEESKTPE